MIASFKISKIGSYGLRVEGLEQADAITTQYLTENSTTPSTRNYKYTESVTVNILNYSTSDGTKSYITHQVGIRNGVEDFDIQDFIIGKDGIFEITHIILPSDKWVASIEALGAGKTSVFNAYGLIYYYDTRDSQFKSYLNGVSSPILISTILSANYEDPVPDGKVLTTVIRADKATFLTYYINETFGKLCQNLFVSLPKGCNINSDSYKQQIFNRDLLLMGINVMKYLTEQTPALYLEAQRLLEDLTTCGILTNTINNVTYGCGCN